MKPEKFSCLSGSVASALALFLLSNVSLGSVAQAQSTATAVSLPSGSTPAPFLVAPSFALAGAPSSVAMGDLNEDGKPDLVAADAVTGKVTVFLGTGDGKFASGVEYATGSHPGVVAVADLNGDGHPEVIVGDASKGTISVFASSGNGTLQLKQTIAMGLDPAYIAVGDFNGDGKTDLAVAASSAASLAIVLNDGKGNLQAPTLTTLHKAPASLTSADLNNDGHADLALANADGTVSILLGAGNGTFRSLADISVASGPLSSIAAGDFDRDGNIDLAVTQSGGKALSVLLGKGNGGFASPANYTVGNNPVSALVTDLDGDGVADLVVINQGSNTYSVLGGNGDGTFKSSLDYVVGNGPVAAVAGEFDANGHIDLAVINPNSQSVTVPLGNGDGTFKAARSYLAGIEPRAVASADLNGDKLPDLVVTNFCGSDSTCSKSGSVAIFLANADGSYKLANTYALGAGPVSVALADVNGDKFPDIIALNRGDKTVSVLLAKGDGSFEQPYTFAVSESPIAVAVGDFNKDGKIDLAVLGDCGAASCSQPGSVEVLTGHGDGSFSSAFAYPTGYSPVSIAVADLNQDKNLDIVVANRCGADATCKSPGTATVLLGGAAGKFTAARDVSVGNSPSSIALGDMIGRGVPDLLVSSSTANTLAVLHGNGDGTFQAPAAYKIGNTPGSVVAADFNGDGKLDVAVANVLDSTVSVLFGKGDGTLNTSFTLPVGTGPAALAAVVGAGGTRASLVTANGNTASATPGTDFTVLANIQPEFTPGAGTTTVAIALGTGATSTSTVDQALALTVTVTAVAPAGTPSGTVTFLSNGAPINDCGSAGVVTLDGTGTAQCSTSSLVAGAPDSLTATYSGDTTYNLNNVSNALSETVNKATPSVTVGFQTGSSTPSTYGESETFLATIGAGGPVLPTGGTVSFTDSLPTPGTPITCSNTVTLTPGTNNSTATCTIASLSGSATHTINATYTAGADPNFNTASSVTGQGLTVGQATPAVVVTVQAGSSSTSTFGTPETFVATITGVSGLAVPTGGTVSFADGVTPITCTNTVTLVTGAASSTATCTIASLTGGPHTINATYTTTTTTDPNYATATSGPGSGASETVSKLTTSTIISSSVQPTSNVDQSVTFTATVSSNPVLTPAPTGTVSFTLNGVAIPSCTGVAINGQGKWTCTTQSLIAPADSIGATYIPGTDPNYLTSNAQPFAQSVSPIPATTTLISSVSSTSTSTSGVNQTVQFTATVVPTGVASPAVLPGGGITFAYGGVTIPTCSSVGLIKNPAAFTSTASCSYTFSKITSGTALTATYNPDANFTSSAAGTQTQVVQAENTTATVAPSTASPLVNASVSYTVTVGFTPSGAAVPSGGMVTVYDSSTTPSPTPLCSATLTGGSLVGVCSQPFTSAGSHPVFAVFTSTDTDFNSSANPPTIAYFASINVQTAGTNVNLTPSPTSSFVNQPVTFTAIVSSTSAGGAIPQGSVTFVENPSTSNTTLCSQVPLKTIGAGVGAQCQVSFTAQNTYSIVATYNPPTSGSSFTTANSSVNLVVNLDPVMVGLAAATLTPTVDQPVLYTATVTPTYLPATPAASLTGSTVSFTYPANGAAQPLCPTPVVPLLNAAKTAYTATCNAPLPAVGPYTITASYSGDTTNFAASAGTANPTVGKAATTGSIASIVPGTPPLTSISVNQEVTFTASVSITPSSDTGTTSPGGSVTFTDPTSAAILCTANLVTASGATTGTATCNGAFASAGTRTVTAAYSGDPNFSGSTLTTTAPTQVVPASVLVAIQTSTPANPTVNQGVTFTATVTASPAGFGTVATKPSTGTLTFYDNGVATSCIETFNQGVEVAPLCTYAFTSNATHNVTAVFTTADSNFTSPSAASPPKTITIGATNTTVAVTTPTVSGSVYVNQPVTFNAVVSSTIPPTPGAPVPQGTVTYMDTSTATTLCTVTLASSGTVPSCTVPFYTSPTQFAAPLTAGSHTIEAVFKPSNNNFGAATSTTPVNVTITQNAPSVTVAITSPAPVPPATTATVTVDQPVIYTATIAESSSFTPVSGITPLAPNGTVSFTFIQAGVAKSNPCTGSQVSTAAGVTTATCSFTFPAASTAGAPYTISAIYSGDPNFTAGNPGTAMQAVGTSVPTVSITSPTATSSFVVNQQVTFTASVAKPTTDTGGTLPSGTVSFVDSTVSPSVPLCTATLATSGTSVGTASCNAAFVTSGGTGSADVRSVTATYNPPTANVNFGNASPATTTTMVNPVPTTTQISSSSPVSVATQPVVFTALVQQTTPPGGLLTGAAVPKGKVVFTSSDGAPNNCGPNNDGVIPVTPGGNGTATAICAFSLLSSSSGPYTITATYTSGDNNFASNVGTVTQTVQNFAVAFTPSAPIVLTQGYSNVTDPFNHVAIAVNSAPTYDFSDALHVTCVVTNTTGSVVTDPSCSPASTSLLGNGTSPVPYTLAASATAPVGLYTATLVATDTSNSTLFHSTALSVYIVGAAGTLSLGPGDSVTESLAFNTAPPAGQLPAASLNSFTCGQIFQEVTQGSSTSFVPYTAGGFTCAAGVNSPTAITGNSTLAAITITVSGGSTTASASQAAPSASIASAAFWGVPFMALLVWLANRKSPRRNFFRFLGALLLMAGVLHTVGCGGHFTPPPTVTGGPAVGTYLIQVVGTDSNGIQHDAVVPLTVN